jgi:hypothetical protein
MSKTSKSPKPVKTSQSRIPRGPFALAVEDKICRIAWKHEAGPIAEYSVLAVDPQFSMIRCKRLGRPDEVESFWRPVSDISTLFILRDADLAPKTIAIDLSD